jgi:hypothetical protein
MPGFGCIPSNNQWEHRTYDVDSAATFRKGSLVNLTPARNVDEFASTDSQFLGVANHNSVDSLPAGKVNLSVPLPGAKMIVDVPAGFVASELSLGQAGTIYKSGNTVSYLTVLTGSAMTRHVVICGPLLSATSQIEVALTADGRVFNSGSTATFAS